MQPANTPHASRISPALILFYIAWSSRASKVGAFGRMDLHGMLVAHAISAWLEVFVPTMQDVLPVHFSGTKAPDGLAILINRDDSARCVRVCGHRDRGFERLCQPVRRKKSTVPPTGVPASSGAPPPP